MDLDKEQQKAAKTKKDRIMIIAGPGSGKTRTLVYRIKNLIEHGIRPNKILALTFTNKSAQEMKRRLKELLPDTNSSLPYAGTIHALCVQILSTELSDDFTIYTQSDQKQIVKLIKEKYKLKGKITEILKNIEKYKLMDEKKVNDDVKTYILKYNKFLKKNNALDFTDLLIKTIDLFKSHPDIRKKYQNKWQYVLVDEYQDINSSQQQLILFLTKQNNNLFVIGDADQAIYGFRGASVKHFLEFQDKFEDVQVIKLTRNYRSTPEIVNNSLSIIKHNKKRLPFTYESMNNPREKVKIVSCGDDKDEAKYISTEIEKRLGGTTLFHLDSNLSDGNAKEYFFSDFTVMYRTNAFPFALEREFQYKGIPYQIVGKDNFWDREIIRVLINLLKYTETKDILAERFLKEHSIPPSPVSSKPHSSNFINSFIEDYGLKENYNNGDNAIETFLQIVSEAEAKTIQELLQHISLLSRETYIDPRANTVKLMTLHQAKGLEFETVFIAGCEEGLIPFIKTKEATEIEEERRLFYVGMTRAKSYLYLTHANSRILWGKNSPTKVSQFIKELDSENIETIQFKRKYKKKDQMKMF